MGRPARIISGGQTGADMGGLRAGYALGIPTGGTMPRLFRNERGFQPWMHKRYGMVQHASPQYQPRTRMNIVEAQLTVVFGDLRTPGTYLTVQIATELGARWLVNPTIAQLQAVDPTWTVNIAGNRASGNWGIEAYVYRQLIEAWALPEQVDHLRACAPWPDPLPRLTHMEAATTHGA